MAVIRAKDIEHMATQLIAKAVTTLPPKAEQALRKAKTTEMGMAKDILNIVLENADIAKTKGRPLCQDTGLAVFFAEVGVEVRLEEPLFKTLNRATKKAYSSLLLRDSVCADPLFGRQAVRGNVPPVLHEHLVAGGKLRLTFLPKGAGAENTSVLNMLRPADGRAGVVATVVEACQKAGGASCPPWTIGVGVGGAFDTAPALAKQAILRPLGRANPQAEYAAMEREMLEKINALGIGAMGVEGRVAALAVHIEAAPCHIASLPVAINFQCHSARVARGMLGG